MSTVTFDTLELVEKLKSAGMEQKHAEAVVRVIAESHESFITKEYLDYKLEKELSALKIDLIKWMTGALIAQAAVVATLVKLL